MIGMFIFSPPDPHQYGVLFGFCRQCGAHKSDKELSCIPGGNVPIASQRALGLKPVKEPETVGKKG